ncbi:MAG: PadR family transcriptional regulator [Thermoanaerobacteraceae bacterium]|nr:PadR family transcriptional regulator [Thermoanaerobacteraceae bacterium]
MKDNLIRKMFLGFIEIHILYHASKEPIFGLGIMEELKRHGYKISPGSLYPILHNMEADGLLNVEEKIIDGKIRKYYTSTDKGREVLKDTIIKADELLKEIKEV